MEKKGRAKEPLGLPLDQNPNEVLGGEQAPVQERIPGGESVLTSGVGALVPVEETEVALYEKAQQNLIHYLSRSEAGISVIRRRAEMLDTAYFVALKRTRPFDWYMTRLDDGSEFATLVSSGAHAIAPVYGVSLQNVRPVDEIGVFAPQRIPVEDQHGLEIDGVYTLRAWADVFVALTGVILPAMEASRRSDEDFTGRSTNAEGKIVGRGDFGLDGDLRAAVWTLLFTKAVRIGCGMSKVPKSHLADAWKNDPLRSVESVPKGHGYGSSEGRRATAVAEEGVEESRSKLRAEILRRTGGDLDSSRNLLKEVTSSKNFKGFDQIERLTKDWQVAQAMKALKAHPLFGDAMVGSGDDDDE